MHTHTHTFCTHVNVDRHTATGIATVSGCCHWHLSIRYLTHKHGVILHGEIISCGDTDWQLSGMTPSRGCVKWHTLDWVGWRQGCHGFVECWLLLLLLLLPPRRLHYGGNAALVQHGFNEGPCIYSPGALPAKKQVATLAQERTDFHMSGCRIVENGSQFAARMKILLQR